MLPTTPRNSPAVTVIVPVYNPGPKFPPMLASLRAARVPGGMEVVFVDDQSTDGSWDTLQHEAANEPAWSVHRMGQNTGSPSEPRNVGLTHATGEYVMFFDADDQLRPDGIAKLLAAARAVNADVARGAVERVEDNTTMLLNTLPQFDPALPYPEQVALVIGETSTTTPGLIRRTLLMDHHVRWDGSLRMGEDTVFLASVLAHATQIAHIDDVVFTYDATTVPGRTSSTQRYGDKELRDHVRVWTETTRLLEPHGLNYMALRGSVGLRNVLKAIVRRGRDDFSEEAFTNLHQLVTAHRDDIDALDYTERHTHILDTIRAGNYTAFRDAIKPRLLIAGYDLKFILPAVPALSEHFTILVDEWTGHDQHDLAQSRRLLDWADVIHCEWMLGNAVWYSRHKKPHQRLIVRLHRFELTRTFGDEADYSAIDQVVCVSPITLEQAVARFALDRTKVSLIPNYVDVDAYERSDDPDRCYNLAMIGAIPRLKGLLRAYRLLRRLRMIDSRYTLTVYGKRPKDVPWIRNDPAEDDYLAECERYAENNNLERAVTWAGWSDTTVAAANHGIVLSLSDLESFHVAPADAFAAGNVGVLRRWPGVEYVYPDEFIVDSLTDMTNLILRLRDPDVFAGMAERGSRFVKDNYDLPVFVRLYRNVTDNI